MSYTTVSLGIPATSTNIKPSQGLNQTPTVTPSPTIMSTTLSPGTPGTPGATPGTSCCSTGRPILTDPLTGQTVCSCQLTPSLMSYPRLASLPESLYGSAAYTAQALMASPFAAAAANGAAEPAAYFSPFAAMNPYDLKEASEVYRGLAQSPAGCLQYDPTAMFAYPFGAGYGGMDLSAARRNKNATRETTSTLKAWLYEHRKNPYPTKGEKIMLAIITKMTLTQVSTWFANARRRLKKENKMTWTPKNGSGNDSDNDDEDNDESGEGVAGSDSKDSGTVDRTDSVDDEIHHRLNDSHENIDIDTLSEKDESDIILHPTDDEGSDSEEQRQRLGRDGSSRAPCRTSDPSQPPTSPSDGPDRPYGPPRDNTGPSPSCPSSSNISAIPPGILRPSGFFAPYNITNPTCQARGAQSEPFPSHPGVRAAGTTSSTGAHSISTSTASRDSNSSPTASSSHTVHKPKIWSLADIVSSSSSSNSSTPHAGRSSTPPPGLPAPLRPTPGPGQPVIPSALSTLRAWTEATGSPYGLAAAAAAAHGLPHAYARPPGPSAGLSMGGFPMPTGLSLMAAQHHNGFYSRPGERPTMTESRIETSSLSYEGRDKTAFKPVIKSKLNEVKV